jgi:serine/threonine-protein kinase
MTGVVMGTPLYMSPEQAMGKTREVDHRSDIYALGVMLYQMLAGRVPFVSDNFAALVIKHIHEQPPALCTVRPDVPADWEAIVARSLAKTPGERFQSMADLAAAITASDRPRRAARRSRYALPLGLAAIVALTTVIVLTMFRLDRQPSPEVVDAPSVQVVASAPAIPDAAAAIPDAAVPPRDASPPEPPAAQSGPRPDDKHAKESDKLGRLRIVAQPWAKVYIAGRSYGTTPVTVQLPQGRHRVTLKNEELDAVKTESVGIKPGSSRELKVNMRK